MSRRVALIVVEGPHGRAFIGRALGLLGFTSFRDKPNKGHTEKLENAWKAWIPVYPKNGNLYMPLDMPYIWQTEPWSVGVLAAGGSELYSQFPTQLGNKVDWVEEHLKQGHGALGVIIDADQKPVQESFEALKRALAPKLTSFPEAPGLVLTEPFRLGTFVLPDNSAPGTVETLLLPLGETHHGRLLAHARTFLAACEPDLKAHFAPFDYLKATLAGAASILQPGSTNTVTIEKDKWVTADHLHSAELAPLLSFLRQLLDLPQS